MRARAGAPGPPRSAEADCAIVPHNDSQFRDGTQGTKHPQPSPRGAPPPADVPSAGPVRLHCDAHQHHHRDHRCGDCGRQRRRADHDQPLSSPPSSPSGVAGSPPGERPVWSLGGPAHRHACGEVWAASFASALNRVQLPRRREHSPARSSVNAQSWRRWHSHSIEAALIVPWHGYEDPPVHPALTGRPRSYSLRRQPAVRTERHALNGSREHDQ